MAAQTDKQVRIINTKRGNGNKFAIEMALNTSSTLIITGKHSYVPSLASLTAEMRDGSISILESSDVFDAIISTIQDFKTFIIVNLKLNLFEKEFFSQLANKLNKEFIAIIED